MLVSVEGRMGMGKTLTATYFGVKEHQENGKRIFATYHLHGVKYEYLTLETFYKLFTNAEQGITELSHCVFLLDEAYLFMDSRLSSSQINRLFNAFTFQSRKREVDIFLTTHDIMRIDRRIRSNIDIRISCRFNPTTQRVTLRMRDMHTGWRKRVLISAPAVYPYYSTEEIVRPQGKAYRIKQADLL
ncbi:hypothetical protein LCGC14_1827730 [marine sediment metagenome]|uniref:Zona occludens toxin N-terminal domain-containing protein n=1 Tax=marine sediment metagenome TaxID=412755 RepID=A0A0F9JGI2_9ZZZZ